MKEFQWFAIEKIIYRYNQDLSRRLKPTTIKTINSVEFNFLNEMKIYLLKQLYVYPPK